MKCWNKNIIFALLLSISFSACGSSGVQSSESVVESQVLEHAQIESVSREDIPETEASTEGIHLIALPDTTIQAQFRVPNTLHYEIANVVYDNTGEQYAILYAVSDYDGDRESFTYNRDNGCLHIQLFDKQGMFLSKIETDLVPATNSRIEVVPSEICTFRKGFLTFFAQSQYILVDTATGHYNATYASHCVTDGDYYLVVDEAKGFKGGDTEHFALTLYHLDQNVGKISVPVEDYDLHLQAQMKTLLYTLDGPAGIATFGVDKMTYHLDFNAGSWDLERHYTREHLDELVAVSDDARWELYYATCHGVGTVTHSDLVTLDTQTGAISFLTLGTNYGVVLGPDGQGLVNQINQMKRFDIANEEILDEQFGGNSETQDWHIKGISYDRRNNWYLVVWYPPLQTNDREERPPLLLSLYTPNGELVRIVETGLSEIISGKGVDYNTLELVLDDMGSVRFITPHGEFGSCTYL